VISEAGRLYRGTLSDTASFTSLSEIRLDPFGAAIAVAVGPGNELYVAVRPPGGSAGTPAFAVLALVPRF
jgi:hypothetical protein